MTAEIAGVVQVQDNDCTAERGTLGNECSINDLVSYVFIVNLLRVAVDQKHAHRLIRSARGLNTEVTIRNMTWRH